VAQLKKGNRREHYQDRKTEQPPFVFPELPQFHIREFTTIEEIYKGENVAEIKIQITAEDRASISFSTFVGNGG
jgi:hypothetical protein